VLFVGIHLIGVILKNGMGEFISKALIREYGPRNHSQKYNSMGDSNCHGYICYLWQVKYLWEKYTSCLGLKIKKKGGGHPLA